MSLFLKLNFDELALRTPLYELTFEVRPPTSSLLEPFPTSLLIKLNYQDLIFKALSLGAHFQSSTSPSSPTELNLMRLVSRARRSPEFYEVPFFPYVLYPLTLSFKNFFFEARFQNFIFLNLHSEFHLSKIDVKFSSLKALVREANFTIFHDSLAKRQ